MLIVKDRDILCIRVGIKGSGISSTNRAISRDDRFCRVMGLTLFSVNGDGNSPNNGNGVKICRSEKDSR